MKLFILTCDTVCGVKSLKMELVQSLKVNFILVVVVREFGVALYEILKSDICFFEKIKVLVSYNLSIERNTFYRHGCDAV